jgi:hypothetical protein
VRTATIGGRSRTDRHAAPTDRAHRSTRPTPRHAHTRNRGYAEARGRVEMYKPFARCVVLCSTGVGGCVVLCGSRRGGCRPRWWLVSHSHSEHLFVCVCCRAGRVFAPPTLRPFWGQVAVAKFFSRHLDLVRCRSPRRSPYRIGGLPRFPGVQWPAPCEECTPVCASALPSGGGLSGCAAEYTRRCAVVNYLCARFFVR